MLAVGLLVFQLQGCSEERKGSSSSRTEAEPARKESRQSARDASLGSHAISPNVHSRNLEDSGNSLDMQAAAEVSDIARRIGNLTDVIRAMDTQALEQAALLIGRDNETEARGMCASLLADNHSEEMLFLLADKAGRRGNHFLKYHILSNLFARSESEDFRANCCFQLILCMDDLHRYREKIQWCDYLLESHGETIWLNMAAIDGKAWAYERLGDYHNAISYYQQSLDMSYSACTDRRLAECHCKCREYDEAMKCAARGLENAPDEFSRRLFLALLQRIEEERTQNPLTKAYRRTE